MYRLPPIRPQRHPIWAEIGTFLPKSGSKLRCSSAYGVAAGVSQGDGWGARERDFQDPLCLLLLVLFLQEQEKYRQNINKVNDHLWFCTSGL